MNNETVTIVEIDQPFCQLEYGTSPCQAFLRGNFIKTSTDWEAATWNVNPSLTGTSRNFSNAPTLYEWGFSETSALSSTFDITGAVDLSVFVDTDVSGQVELVFNIGSINQSYGIVWDTQARAFSTSPNADNQISSDFAVAENVTGTVYRIGARYLATGSEFVESVIIRSLDNFLYLGGPQVYYGNPSELSQLTEYVPTTGTAKASQPTGTRKCHNTAFTCQDRDNYDPATLTLRFCTSQAGVAQYDAIPSLRDVRISPLQINIGGMDESVSPFGRRETCDLQFADHLHSDLKVDKYRLERQSGAAQEDGQGYDPYVMGTFWGKWIARNPYHEGFNVRVYEGVMGQDLSEMEVRNYVIDKINGPTEGQVSVQCKDLFSLTEDRKAKAPKASRGELASAVAAGDSSLTLAPSGIGDEDYPSSGWVAINDEAIQFSRSGDTLTLNTRGALNTTAEDHEEEDKVQVILAYEGETVPDILEDLLVNYANVPASYIPKSEWNAEANDNINELYTAYIAEPTPVEDLVGELAVQAGFSIWPEVKTNQIRIKAIIPPVLEEDRPLVTDDEWIKEGTFSIQRKPQQRTSQVWVYYGQRNPLEDVDDPTNYASRVIEADLPSESDEEYGTPSIREVWGRWIPRFGRAVAETAGDRILSIFRDPPFRGSFEVDIRRDGDLSLASPFRLETDDVQSATGERAIRNMVPIQAFRNSMGVSVKFQQLAFFSIPDQSPGGGTVYRVYIDDDANNFHLRTEYNELYGTPQDGDEVRCIISDSVVVGSTSTGSPAFNVGDWPAGVDVIVIIGSGAYVVGASGSGGRGSGVDSSNLTNYIPATDGANGGLAFYSRYAVSVDNSGTIGGGAGGGGGGGGGDSSEREFYAGGGGGGGNGLVRGSGGPGGDGRGLDPDGFYPANNGQDGQQAAQVGGSGGSGGSGATGPTFVRPGDGGNGGTLGQPGQNGETTQIEPSDFFARPPGSGGSPGNAIDGDSFVSFTAQGTITGPRVN